MRRARHLFAVLLVASLTACADPGSSPATTTATGSETTTTAPSNLGGDGQPVQNPSEEYGHFPTSLAGNLELEDNGCWFLSLGGRSEIIVFPEGFTRGTNGISMVDPAGNAYTSGQAIDALGGSVGAASMPGVPDGFWGNYIEFCAPTADVVVVVDALEPAFDPTTLSGDQLYDLAREAELTRSWGCGLGFTLSSSDQRVALYLTPNDYETVPTSPVNFPDDGWTATLVIGKNLMVNHCDDVAEFWEPDRIVAAEWPVESGTLAFEPSGAELIACGASGPVEATLSNLTVETPNGPLELGELEVVNDAYGCFAG